jgi:hypothetical protein
MYSEKWYEVFYGMMRKFMALIQNLNHESRNKVFVLASIHFRQLWDGDLNGL